MCPSAQLVVGWLLVVGEVLQHTVGSSKTMPLERVASLTLPHEEEDFTQKLVVCFLLQEASERLKLSQKSVSLARQLLHHYLCSQPRRGDLHSSQTSDIKSVAYVPLAIASLLVAAKYTEEVAQEVSLKSMVQLFERLESRHLSLFARLQSVTRRQGRESVLISKRREVAMVERLEMEILRSVGFRLYLVQRYEPEKYLLLMIQELFTNELIEDRQTQETRNEKITHCTKEALKIVNDSYCSNLCTLYFNRPSLVAAAAVIIAIQSTCSDNVSETPSDASIFQMQDFTDEQLHRWAVLANGTGEELKKIIKVMSKVYQTFSQLSR